MSDAINPFHTSSTGGKGETGTGRLYAALKTVLKESCDEELRALSESSSWYTEDLPVEEVFRLWIQQNLICGHDPQWVFQPLRITDRKYVCDELGIDRKELIGRSQEELARTVLQSAGIPGASVFGFQSETKQWEQVIGLIDDGQDERASVLLRQTSERFLRRLLHFYCALQYEKLLGKILRNPGSLVVPAKVQKVLERPEDDEGVIAEVLLEEGWATLGFLSILLRKLSVRIEELEDRHINGKRMEVLKKDEQAAFERLSKALQAYAHDRPAKKAVRKQELREAAVILFQSIRRMIERGIVPDELIVLETGQTVTGHFFLGAPDEGPLRRLTTTKAPDLGDQILCVVAASCPYAGCRWIQSPWS